MRGNVSDPSGGAIQNATVHLINLATNADRTATTDQRGSYTFPDVAPGAYRLRVEAPGFEPYEQDDIRVQGNAPTTLDVKLKVSQVQQSVRVTAQTGDQCIAPKGRILPDGWPGPACDSFRPVRELLRFDRSRSLRGHLLSGWQTNRPGADRTYRPLLAASPARLAWFFDR